MVAPPIHPLTDYGPEMSAGQQVFVGRFEHSITSRPNRLRFHRHTYYEVFWINGWGSFFADFREYPIRRSHAYLCQSLPGASVEPKAADYRTDDLLHPGIL
jgi:hypothetical protein